MPKPNSGEKKEEFIPRCMGSSESKSTFPDAKQRAAFCYSQWSKYGGKNALELDAIERDENNG